MNTRISLDVHNRFDAVLTNVQTGEERHYTAYNTVLDNYFATLRAETSTTNRGAGYLQVGTGTGTIDITDVSLFNLISGKLLTELGVTCLSHTRFERKATVTFTETEAIGNLTEVGVATGNSNRTLVTHAFFTDGEGNPISIPKTNTDRLTVTVTIYADFTITGPVRRFSVPDGYGTRELTDILGYKNEIGNTMTINSSTHNPPYHFAYWVTCSCNGIRNANASYGNGEEFTLCATPYPLDLTFSSNGFWEYYRTNQSDTTISGNLVRTEMRGQINSDVGNKSKTYQIKALAIFSLFYLPFPNESIFPKKKLTFELAGDGVTSGWDLGVPMLMTDNVTVSIDGVVQSPSTYTFTGRDLTCLQGLPSAQAECLVDTNVKHHGNSSTILPVGVRTAQVEEGLPWYFVYDFGQPITIDTVQGRRNCELYHSNDGNTWTLAAQVTASGTLTKVAFTPISSRYWKLVITVKDTQSSSPDFITPAYWGFYLDKHQIEFNNPPANGSLIEIDAYTEYPLKNDKWIIDQILFDFTIERGSGS